MKRHPGLARLSREHHRALVLAKHALNAAGDGPQAQSQMAAGIAAAFSTDLEPHFRTEERWLLPALNTAGQSGAVERTLSEHAALREFARRISSGDASCLAEFGTLLEAHVRFEERSLFALAENCLPTDVLDQINDGKHESSK